MQVIDAANDVIDSVDKDELAKYFSLRSDPEDEEAEVPVLHQCLPYATLSYVCFSGLRQLIFSSLIQKIKKKMEMTRDQLAEALYQKGLALVDIESLEVGVLCFN